MAFVSGPIIGGPFEPQDDAPRAVSKKYFDKVCPPSKRVILNPLEINNDTIRFSSTIGASYIFDLWVEKINSIEDQCVEISHDLVQLWEIWQVKLHSTQYLISLTDRQGIRFDADP